MLKKTSGNYKLAVTTAAQTHIPAAKNIADFLAVPFIDYSAAEINHYDYLLLYTANYLSIVQTNMKKSKPFFIDFSSTANLFRLKQISRRKELLARAIGIHPKENPNIIDVTAGLGRDSFILAALGYHITLLERSALVFLLLKDAFMRAEKNTVIKPIINRLQLNHADSIDWLKNLAPTHLPDVIYMDPMFPERKKKTLAKKEMLIVQNLIGKDSDADQLFTMALTCARRRVVIKRPRLAENMDQRLPNFSFTGKASRFDIYLK